MAKLLTDKDIAGQLALSRSTTAVHRIKERIR